MPRVSSAPLESQTGLAGKSTRLSARHHSAELHALRASWRRASARRRSPPVMSLRTFAADMRKSGAAGGRTEFCCFPFNRSVITLTTAPAPDRLQNSLRRAFYVRLFQRSSQACRGFAVVLVNSRAFLK